ncbi:MAG: hypothetical protein IH587_11160 [Anaerolineae bacterium]|nr:hypothetical protein [Anaerolineae bacterium]
MTKRKRDIVNADMRDRLKSNRDGRLSSAQWIAITADPLVTLLLLLAPAMLILGLRLPLLLARGWLVLLVILAVYGGMILMRAQRYARARVHYKVLYAARPSLTRWALRRSPSFYDDRGQVFHFTRWLAPRVSLTDDHAYLVYYLDGARERVLCSLAPLTHEDAAKFQPTPEFHRRFERRAAPSKPT